MGGSLPWLCPSNSSGQEILWLLNLHWSSKGILINLIILGIISFFLVNNTTDKEEENILKEYYEALDKKNKLEVELELLNNQKLRLNNELEEFEYNIKKENSIYNEKTNLLHELEIEVNRDDLKLDTLLNTLTETYSMTYEKAITLYKLDIEPNIA